MSPAPERQIPRTILPRLVNPICQESHLPPSHATRVDEKMATAGSDPASYSIFSASVANRFPCSRIATGSAKAKGDTGLRALSTLVFNERSSTAVKRHVIPFQISKHTTSQAPLVPVEPTQADSVIRCAPLDRLPESVSCGALLAFPFDDASKKRSSARYFRSSAKGSKGDERQEKEKKVSSSSFSARLAGWLEV